jgi:hypothetical protein
MLNVLQGKDWGTGEGDDIAIGLELCIFTREQSVGALFNGESRRGWPRSERLACQMQVAHIRGVAARTIAGTKKVGYIITQRPGHTLFAPEWVFRLQGRDTPDLEFYFGVNDVTSEANILA